MDLLTGALIVVGLVVFETISSIDNAIINADVLATMGQRARRWFLIWGLLFAVFVIRGVLPWLIVWIATPGLGPIEALTATFSEDPRVIAAIEESAPIMLTGGGRSWSSSSSTGSSWSRNISGCAGSGSSSGRGSGSTPSPRSSCW